KPIRSRRMIGHGNDRLFFEIGRSIQLGDDSPMRRLDGLTRKVISERAAAEMQARVQVSTDLTVNELAAAYLRHNRTYHAKRGPPTPECGDVSPAIQPVRTRHGHELVTAFGPLKLKAIRQQSIADGLVRAQINARPGRVRRMFAWGVEEELVPPGL